MCFIYLFRIKDEFTCKGFPACKYCLTLQFYMGNTSVEMLIDQYNMRIQNVVRLDVIVGSNRGVSGCTLV